MSNFIANWWRSQQLKSALSRGDTRRAVQLLQDIQKSGANFSWLEKLFRDKLQLERSFQEYKREKANLTKQITDASQKVDELNLQLTFDYSAEIAFKPNEVFISKTLKDFELFNKDKTKIQCTGIDRNTFDELEKYLIEYLEDELKQKSSKKGFLEDLRIASEDIISLKKGKDPDYQYAITPHVYFMRYFLEGVYSAYIAWFLVYKAGLLKPKINLLDIGAGSGSIFYGLFALLKNVCFDEKSTQIHVSYCSFEKQKYLQYYGLQFWRKYEKYHNTPAVNAYLRFYTSDIFQYATNASDLEQLPNNFYDFISISHCIFAEKQERIASHQKYKYIFQKALKNDGYILVVVQGRRLCQAYERQMTEDESQEKNLIEMFVEELGLKLVWYKYITSTGKRKPMISSEFARFARENLPIQKYMTELAKKYQVVNHDLNYVLDDYVILARK
ncbi:photosystem II assembly protein [Cylindrospermum sp. FACHB-282]|uniref:photosystem II assembly protein n=1 Tax=Cylindrospermum sp. FACHB-282 TaxID=2692794 RepID=UPI001684B922|nr:photosystem II assembly protein [Cylindrospermum sp. FACHB-282]MBD2387379.1 photosystem II assembly protein [Cylindrospermum sp. FACHB-282]